VSIGRRQRSIYRRKICGRCLPWCVELTTKNERGIGLENVTDLVCMIGCIGRLWSVYGRYRDYAGNVLVTPSVHTLRVVVVAVLLFAWTTLILVW